MIVIRQTDYTYKAQNAWSTNKADFLKKAVMSDEQKRYENIYCNNDCANKSDVFKNAVKSWSTHSGTHEIYTSENYPTITELLSVDKFEYCSTCETRISEQDFHVNKSIEIIDKVIFSEKNQALLGDHVNHMQERNETKNPINATESVIALSQIIDITEEFYDGINDLHKEFMQKIKKYKENK